MKKIIERMRYDPTTSLFTSMIKNIPEMETNYEIIKTDCTCYIFKILIKLILNKTDTILGTVGLLVKNNFYKDIRGLSRK